MSPNDADLAGPVAELASQVDDFGIEAESVHPGKRKQVPRDLTAKRLEAALCIPNIRVNHAPHKRVEGAPH